MASLEKNFKRGDVFNLYIPQLDFGTLTRPSFILEGNHMVVVLHDSDHCGYNQKQVNVAPISSAEGAVKSRTLLPSHIFLEKGSYDFITKDCYICTHQTIPINRSWLLGTSPKGSLKKKHIKKLDLGLIHSNGLLETVLEFQGLAKPKSKKKRQHNKKKQVNYIQDPTKLVLFSSLFKKSKKKKKKLL